MEFIKWNPPSLPKLELAKKNPPSWTRRSLSRPQPLKVENFSSWESQPATEISAVIRIDGNLFTISIQNFRAFSTRESLGLNFPQTSTGKISFVRTAKFLSRRWQKTSTEFCSKANFACFKKFAKIYKSADNFVAVWAFVLQIRSLQIWNLLIRFFEDFSKIPICKGRFWS